VINFGHRKRRTECQKFLVLDCTRQLPNLRSLEISPVLASPFGEWELLTFYQPPNSVYNITERISKSVGEFEVPGGIDMVASVVPELRVGDIIFTLRQGKYVPEEDCWETGSIYDNIMMLA
jgi:hypothetical protein